MNENPFLNTDQTEHDIYRFKLNLLRFFKKHRVWKEEDREELIQETFARALATLEKWDKKCPFEGWLFGIAKNVISEYWRKIKGGFTTDSFDTNDSNEPTSNKNDGNTVEETDHRWGDSTRLQKCFESLSKEDQILMWRYVYRDDRHYLIEDDEDYDRLPSRLSQIVLYIRRFFRPYQDQYQPFTTLEKKKFAVQVLRIRIKLELCLGINS
jgi:RNA polymerase sigma factor (sigma-70 family)